MRCYVAETDSAENVSRLKDSQNCPLTMDFSAQMQLNHYHDYGYGDNSWGLWKSLLSVLLALLVLVRTT